MHVFSAYLKSFCNSLCFFVFAYLKLFCNNLCLFLCLFAKLLQQFLLAFMLNRKDYVTIHVVNLPVSLIPAYMHSVEEK